MWRQRLFNEYGLSDDEKRQSVADWLNELEEEYFLVETYFHNTGKHLFLLVVVKLEKLDGDGQFEMANLYQLAEAG